MAAILFSLEHGTCLHLVLQLGNLLVSKSYQFHVSLYFFIQVKECSYFRHIMFLVLVKSILPSHLSCLIMFKGSFTSNHSSAVLLVSVSSIIPYSFSPPSHITFLCLFRIDDGVYIMALLRRACSCRLQHIIQELGLETS
jgi:hypothetical protein